MDGLELFPRTSNRPKLFLLLDGHSSRFQVPFLNYINTPTHQWVVCIGLPNSTGHWQVGDLTEQNGCWKIYLSKAKRDLVRYKAIIRMKIEINCTDIVPIINEAWEKSFLKVKLSKQAIAMHVWNLLKRNLLMDLKILKTKPKSEPTTE